jgi:hypothetical protein
MTISGRAAGRWMCAAAVAGLALRAAFGLLYWVGKPLTHDEREYLALAHSLSEGRGFTYDEPAESGTSQQFGRAPGYPGFLAVIGAGRSAGDSAPTRVKLAQAVLGAAAVWLIGAIARRAAGDRAGIAAAWIAAVYPPLVWINAYVFSETLYSVVALLAADRLQRAVPPQRSPVPNAGAAGLLIGAAILIRPAMLFFLPLALGWLLLRRTTIAAIAVLAATVVVVGPWTVRNAHVYGRFVLVASEGGVTFWTGNHPLARGEGDLAANPDLKVLELEFRRSHPGLTAEQLEPLYYRDAFAAIGRDPVRWLGLLARKTFYTVVPTGPSYTLHSTRYRAASVISYLVLLPLATIGIRRLWKSEHRPVSLLLLGASAVLAGLVFFPQERFRIPVIDPVLIVAAAAAIASPPRGEA